VHSLEGLNPGWSIQAVKYGGQEEYDFVVKAHDNHKTPSEKIAAMLVNLDSVEEH